MQTDRGSTALFVASLKGHDKCVEALLRCHANPHVEVMCHMMKWVPVVVVVVVVVVVFIGTEI
jgi:hypothetical protein